MITVAEPEHYVPRRRTSILANAEFRDLEREETQRILDLAIGRVPADLPVDARLLSGSPGRLLADAGGSSI